MPTPTAATIRGLSKVDFNGLGYTDDPLLQVLVDRAIGTVTRWTGQSWTGGGVYSNLEPAIGSEAMAVGAVQSLTEVMAFRSQEDVSETLSDFDLLSSFTAGDYSETRRSGKDSREANLAMLWSALWPLMTFEKQDDFQQLVTGQNAPAFAVTEVDWGTTADSMPAHGSLPYDFPWPPVE